ncbi:hypothetical protein DPEC_G00360530 [Dallia pectoralis]|uniref:Uncharacterized protein n=1 Tax=Dallia pectoralis TaxID=75939 RepID=A0ACC2F0T4_DALPE|nr:hypothetical protein DPEC_G00360530 [Dallia pectoralis]
MLVIQVPVSQVVMLVLQVPVSQVVMLVLQVPVSQIVSCVRPHTKDLALDLQSCFRVFGLGHPLPASALPGSWCSAGPGVKNGTEPRLELEESYSQSQLVNKFTEVIISPRVYKGRGSVQGDRSTNVQTSVQADVLPQGAGNFPTALAQAQKLPPPSPKVPDVRLGTCRSQIGNSVDGILSGADRFSRLHSWNR